MILTVFRSRLNEGIREAYDADVAHTAPLAEASPGFLGHKMFVAEDGERLTVVAFESMAAQRAWSLSQAHRDAAKAGRRAYYSEYTIQICEVLRESHFKAPGPVPSPAPAPREAIAG